jgi:hypothetical protein
MAIPLEKIYDVFYSTVKIDFSKYPELDVNVSDNLIEVYLDSATYDYEENLGTTLTIDKVNLEITDEIPQSHIKILGRLIYKNYLERELNHALQIANQFNKRSELNVTGMPVKIVALRDCLSRCESELKRSFTRNIMKGVGKAHD